MTVITNFAPQFNSTSISPNPPKIGMYANYSATVYDQDGSIQYTNLSLSGSAGCSISDVKRTGTTPSWDGLCTPSGEGWLNATFETVDNEGAVTTTGINRYLQDNAATVTIHDPDNQIYASNPDWNFSASDTDDKPDESLDWTVESNGKQIASGTDPENITYKTGPVNNTVEGTNTVTVTVTDPAGNTDQQSVTWTLDTTPPQIDITDPVDPVNTTTDIPLNYTVTDANTVSTCIYNVKNQSSTVIDNTTLSSCGNTTFNVPEIGNYTATVYANDTVDNLGKQTKPFTAQLINSWTLEDAATGNVIQEWSVTFTNDTTTTGGSTDTGTFTIPTRKLPTGNVTAQFKATGYEKKTLYYTINSSTEIDATVQMQRTSFAFTVRSELQPLKKLHFNATVTNQSKQIKMESVVENHTTNTGYATYINEDWMSADTVDFIANEQDGDAGGGGENCYRITYTLLNGSVFEKEECQGAKDVAATVTIGDRLYHNLKFSLWENGTGSDSFNVDVKVFDDGKDGFDAEYKNLNNAGFPLGSTTWRVENTGYRDRTYFTTISSTLSVALTSYLLRDGQGILINIETLDPSLDPLANAKLTIQRLINSNYVTVSQDKTASAGTAGFYLDPDVQYQVLATHPLYAPFQGTFSPANYQFDPLTIVFGGASQDFTTVWDQISYNIKPNATSLPAASNVSINATIIDPEDALTSFSLNVTNENGTVLGYSQIDDSPSGGTVTTTVNLTNYSAGAPITATLTFVRNGTEFQYIKTYTVIPHVPAGEYSLLKTLNNIKNQTSPLFTGFAAMILMLAFAASLGSQLPSAGGGLILTVVMGIFVLLGWLDGFPYLITLLTLLGLYGMQRG